MRIEFWQPAGADERFGSHAFDNTIGQSCPFKVEGAERGQATVVAVEVAEDGSGAKFTVDIPDADYAPGRVRLR